MLRFSTWFHPAHAAPPFDLILRYQDKIFNPCIVSGYWQASCTYYLHVHSTSSDE